MCYDVHAQVCPSLLQHPAACVRAAALEFVAAAAQALSQAEAYAMLLPHVEVVARAAWPHLQQPPALAALLLAPAGKIESSVSAAGWGHGYAWVAGWGQGYGCWCVRACACVRICIHMYVAIASHCSFVSVCCPAFAQD